MRFIREFSNAKISNHISIIVLGSSKPVAISMKRVFTALNGIPIEMIIFDTSNINPSLVIPELHLQISIERMHKVFFENKS